MQLIVEMAMRFEGEPYESDTVEALNDQLQERFGSGEYMREVTMDASLLNDYLRILGDLDQLVRRAKASRLERQGE